MKLKYGYVKEVSSDFDDTVARVKDALAEEGFGVLTEIDVKSTLKKKLDEDFRRYTIFGACNPPLAHRALTAEPHIGLLLPCNVVVQEHPSQGLTTVSVISASAMFELVDEEDVQPVAQEVDEKLKRVLEAV